MHDALLSRRSATSFVARGVCAPPATMQKRAAREPTGVPVAPIATGSRQISPSHRADIQGLRAVAVLLVVLVHAGVGFVPGGYVGVDVFFVLSGFLITGLLLAEARARSSISLVDFYLRRARRILPAAALTLLATDVAALFLLNFVRARTTVQDSLSAAGFASNFRFAARGVDYFAQNQPPSPVLHYWSLSVEEQFYFVWPLLLSIALFGIALGRRHRIATKLQERRLLRVVVVLAAASLAWSMHLTTTVPSTAYFSPFTRAWELALGATIAVCAATLARTPPMVRLAMGWAGLLAIAFAAITFSDRTPFPGSFALVPTVGTALAIIAGMGDRTPRLAVSRLLALRPMCIIGDRSYTLYLWHWPVLILAAAYMGGTLSVGVKLGLMVGAFLLSCVSYSLVENPIRRRVRSRTATVAVAAVFLAAVLGTAGVSLAAIDRDQQRFERPAATAAPLAPAAVTASQTFGPWCPSRRHRRRRGRAGRRAHPLRSHSADRASSGTSRPHTAAERLHLPTPRAGDDRQGLPYWEELEPQADRPDGRLSRDHVVTAAARDGLA